jgi:hypothetical protein
MTTSDDEYAFDDLVLDDRTLAVLDATEQSLTAAIPSTSPPEQQPTKRLKTNGGWAPRYGQQPRESSSSSSRLTKSRFSLEDTDLPEITISNGFYSGPGRFFASSQQSESPTSPNNPESIVDSGPDVVLQPTAPQPGHASARTVVASSNHPSKRFLSAQPGVASHSSRERTVPANVVQGHRKPFTRHPSPAFGVNHAPRPTPLARSSSFNDAMRAALRSALSEIGSPAIRPLSLTASSGSPSPQPLPTGLDELESLRSRVEEVRSVCT